MRHSNGFFTLLIDTGCYCGAEAISLKLACFDSDVLGLPLVVPDFVFAILEWTERCTLVRKELCYWTALPAPRPPQKKKIKQKPYGSWWIFKQFLFKKYFVMFSLYSEEVEVQRRCPIQLTARCGRKEIWVWFCSLHWMWVWFCSLPGMWVWFCSPQAKPGIMMHICHPSTGKWKQRGSLGSHGLA